MLQPIPSAHPDTRDPSATLLGKKHPVPASPSALVKHPSTFHPATSNSRGVKGNAVKVFKPWQPLGAVSALSALNLQLPQPLGC